VSFSEDIWPVLSSHISATCEMICAVPAMPENSWRLMSGLRQADLVMSICWREACELLWTRTAPFLGATICTDGFFRFPNHRKGVASPLATTQLNTLKDLEHITVISDDR
jgi:hypothetical protein